ncbi:hypothetical protein I350_02991 [Cryptococcus amylolentus CBS 6273]|uniref:Uncharacterized protein n=1 Tax=Cryptococcus amylolentus CBS 6273 TaxID=1296118 RepID=A0A1E3K8K0_9TREE|nr:hypothetical protein I350_02991 [Cryptococcus amylolentus CBS 6273]
MSGGFVTRSGSLEQVKRDRDSATESGGVQILTRLTPKQEARLRTHLDDRLASLERDERTFKLKSLPSLLSRLSPLLQLILQIPPFHPFDHLRTSYLLTLTAVIPSYISALPLIGGSDILSDDKDGEEAQEGDQEELEQKHAGRVLRAVLAFLKEVDKGWLAVLNGEAWSPPPSAFARSDEADSGEQDWEKNVLLGGTPVKVSYAGQVDQTERTRLRSIILTGRSKMLAWARGYGSFPGSSLPGSAATPISLGGSGAGEKEDEEWETDILNMWNGTLEAVAQGE